MSELIIKIEGRNQHAATQQPLCAPRRMPKFRDLSESGKQERLSFKEQRSFVQSYVSKVCGSGGIL